MTATPALLNPPLTIASALTYERAFVFVGERLWLDFVNSDAVRVVDALRDFETLMSWLEAAALVDVERSLGMRRRARGPPSGGAAGPRDSPRVRGGLSFLRRSG